CSLILSFLTCQCVGVVGGVATDETTPPGLSSLRLECGDAGLKRIQRRLVSLLVHLWRRGVIAGRRLAVECIVQAGKLTDRKSRDTGSIQRARSDIGSGVRVPAIRLVIDQTLKRRNGRLSGIDDLSSLCDSLNNSVVVLD